MKLVWLFEEHRALHERAMLLDLAILKLEQRIATQERIIADLETALLRKAAGDDNASSLVKQYQEEVLSELPYPDGKIPAHAWLTPGEDEKVRD